jgi:hypothetical protein
MKKVGIIAIITIICFAALFWITIETNSEIATQLGYASGPGKPDEITNTAPTEQENVVMIRILQLIVLAFGIKELYSAMEYHKQKKTKWAIASLCMGIFACVCAIISITGII